MLNVYEVLELEKKWQKYNDKKNSKKAIFSSLQVKKEKVKDGFFRVDFNKNINMFLFAGIIVVLVLVFACYLLFFKKSSLSNDSQIVTASMKLKFQDPQKQAEKNITNELEQVKIQLEKEKIKLKNMTNNNTNSNNLEDISVNSKSTFGNQDFNDNGKYEITPNDLLTPKLIELKDNTVSYAKEDRQNKKIISNIKPATDVIVSQNKSHNQDVQEIIETDNSSFVVTFSDSKTKIEDLIVAFENKPNAFNAIKVSKRYFDDGDYIKSKAWALKANALDKDNEDSWILFAKSSYKLGRKQDGIKALNDYLKFNNSSNIKNVLKLLEQGSL